MINFAGIFIQFLNLLFFILKIVLLLTGFSVGYSWG